MMKENTNNLKHRIENSNFRFQKEYLKSSKRYVIKAVTWYEFGLELVSKELNHFGVIAGLFRQIGGHSSRFVLFCSF